MWHSRDVPSCSAAAAAGAASAATTWPLAASAAPYRGPLRSDPFTLGVASGDPDPDGFVLWTRLAPTPLAEDGLGGMPDRNVPVAVGARRRRALPPRGPARRPRSPGRSRRTRSTSSCTACCPAGSTSTGSAPTATSRRSAAPAPRPRRGRPAAR